MYLNPTVARLTLRGLLGRRRTVMLVLLPVLLLVISAVVRALSDRDGTTVQDMLTGFALGTMVPLIGVVAGTGAIGPEIDDGSVVYLLAKPVPRSRIVVTKLVVAIGVTFLFAALPTFVAALILAGTDGRVAVAFGLAAMLSSIAYSALFLLFGVVTRHAVVVGLVYAMVWEGFFGGLIEGAKTLSVLQWSLSFAEAIADDGEIDAAVSLPVGAVLLVVVTAGATWLAARRLRSFTISGEE